MSWLLTYASSSVALMLVVIVIEGRLRPEWREAMLWFALMVPILIASLAVLVPAAPVSTSSIFIVPAINVPLRGTVNVNPAGRLGLGAIIVIVWAGTALLMMLRDVFLHRRLIRALDRKLVTSRDVTTMAWRLGLRKNVVLTESRTLPVPIAIGSREICLPSNLLETADKTDFEPIIAHELAHLRRRDPQRQQFARILALAFWWQPLNRTIVKKLAAVAELRADALCATVVVPVRIARTLVQFAQSVQTVRMTGMPAFPSGLLDERVSALLSERRDPSSRMLRVAMSTALALAVLCVAPRFAVLTAQLPVVFQPLIVKASLNTPAAATALAEKRTRLFREPKSVQPGEHDVIAALANLLNDPEIHVRAAARESLGRIGTPESINALADDRYAQADALKGKR